MKSDSQFIRWGIPGWMVAVSYISFMILDYFSANDLTTFNATNNISFNNKTVWWLIIAGFFIAGAGIPLGFLIYQIYFYFRWVSPASKDGLLPPLINGRMREMNESLKDIDPIALGLKSEWREQLIRANQDHRSIWHYISPFLHEACLELDKDNVLRNHINYLKETMHSLGASYLGVSFGYIAYIITKWKLTDATLSSLGYMVAITMVFLLLLSIETRNFRKADSGEKYTGEYAEILLGGLIFLYGTLNPGLNQELHNVLWVIFIIGGLLLGYSLKHLRKVIVTLTIILFIISFAIYNLPLFQPILGNVDWPIALSIICFEFLTIVFLKIRQNTIDQLTSFQYHLTMMYLDRHK